MDNKCINLYDIFLKYSYTDIMELLLNSKTKEETRFLCKFI